MLLCLLHAGLTFLNLLWFIWIARAYVYKDVPHAQKRHVGGLSLKPPRGPVPPWAQAREAPGFLRPPQVRASFPAASTAMSHYMLVKFPLYLHDTMHGAAALPPDSPCDGQCICCGGGFSRLPAC